MTSQQHKPTATHRLRRAAHIHPSEKSWWRNTKPSPQRHHRTTLQNQQANSSKWNVIIRGTTRATIHRRVSRRIPARYSISTPLTRRSTIVLMTATLTILLMIKLRPTAFTRIDDRGATARTEILNCISQNKRPQILTVPAPIDTQAANILTDSIPWLGPADTRHLKAPQLSQKVIGTLKAFF